MESRLAIVDRDSPSVSGHLLRKSSSSASVASGSLLNPKKLKASRPLPVSRRIRPPRATAASTATAARSTEISIAAVECLKASASSSQASQHRLAKTSSSNINQHQDSEPETMDHAAYMASAQLPGYAATNYEYSPTPSCAQPMEKYDGSYLKITPRTGRVSRAKKGLPVHYCESCNKVRRMLVSTFDDRVRHLLILRSSLPVQST